MAGEHRPWQRYCEAFWRAHHEAWKRSEAWTRLAAQSESDKALLSALAELEVGEPIHALTLALKLYSWPPRSDERRPIAASKRAY
jgi:hypothetical protein